MDQDQDQQPTEQTPLPALQSPEARAAFASYVPSFFHRLPHATNVMGLGVRAVRTLPPSYLWAGTIVADTFYGKTTRPGPLPGMTRGGWVEDDNGFVAARKAMEEGE